MIYEELTPQPLLPLKSAKVVPVTLVMPFTVE